MNHLITEYQDRIRAAAASTTPLRITGSGSKAFCLPDIEGEPLDVRGYRGIVEYEPTELVITARAGTPLLELEQALAEHGQMLGFEPPHFAPGATLGGCVAAGLSGPRRPFAGAVRDFVLGVRCLNGRGEDLSFGGRVMKNVAGYDIARLMTGACGSLGLLLEISCKVLPRPEQDQYLQTELPAAEALATMNRLAGRPLPVSGLAWHADQLHVRLSGTGAAVTAAKAQLGLAPDVDEFWPALREQTLAFFTGQGPLWRLSLPSTAPLPALAGECLIDWGGAQRWLKTDTDANQVVTAAQAAGGHARLFRGPDIQPVVSLSPTLAGLQQRLKHAFDPAGIFNPGII